VNKNYIYLKSKEVALYRLTQMPRFYVFNVKIAMNMFDISIILEIGVFLQYQDRNHSAFRNC